MKRRQAPSRAPSHDRWLVSYADFMTLLFAFFATLYAISSVDSAKLTQVAHALQAEFDDSPTGRVAPFGAGVMPEKGDRLVGDAEAMVTLHRTIVESLAGEIESGHLEVGVDHRGVVLSIPEAGAFAIGSDDLSAAARELVNRVGATLATLPNAVRIEGHTDDMPIHTPRFGSNWDLSTARATRVIDTLMTDSRLDPGRLSAAGYAEFRPRVANDSPEARARNRRVDLVVLNEKTANEEPGAERR